MFLENWLNSVALLSQKNGQVVMGYGAYQTFATFNEADLNRPIFYIPDFFLSDARPWIQYEQTVEVSIHKLKSSLSPLSIKKNDWHISDQEIFNTQFHHLKELFHQNELQKAVPYVFAFSHQNMNNERLSHTLYHALEQLQNYSGYLYGHWVDGEGFLGLTPEILFENKNNHIKTMALAGTKRLKINNEDFLNDPKELTEHQFVIDGLKESLKNLGEVTVGQTHILHLPRLSHLHTAIEIKLNQTFNFKEIVEKMHPTPALGAFPKDKGKEWLLNYELKIPRKTYGAPFGLYCVLDQYALCVVGIRQVQWNKENMRIGAGCGVIKASILENEWKEIELKIQSIRKLLDL